MAPRYHFDLENGHESIRDEQGVLADDVGQAIEQAVLGANEMRASGELPDTAGKWSLVIRDEVGTELKRIRL